MKLVTVSFPRSDYMLDSQGPYCLSKGSAGRIRGSIAENYKKKKLIQEFNEMRIKSIFENYKTKQTKKKSQIPAQTPLSNVSQVIQKSKTSPDEELVPDQKKAINPRLQHCKYLIKSRMEDSTQNISNCHKSFTQKQFSEEDFHVSKIQNFQFSTLPLPELTRKSDSCTKIFKNILGGTQMSANQRQVGLQSHIDDLFGEVDPYAQNILQNERLRYTSSKRQNQNKQEYGRKTPQHQQLENNFFGVFPRHKNSIRVKQNISNKNFEKIKMRIMEQNEFSSFNKSENDHHDNQLDVEEYFHYYVQNQKQYDC